MAGYERGQCEEGGGRQAWESQGVMQLQAWPWADVGGWG